MTSPDRGRTSGYMGGSPRVYPPRPRPHTIHLRQTTGCGGQAAVASTPPGRGFGSVIPSGEGCTAPSFARGGVGQPHHIRTILKVEMRLRAGDAEGIFLTMQPAADKLLPACAIPRRELAESISVT